MDLDDLRILVAAAAHGSSLGASRALDLPRSTVRRRLERLEREVGTPLMLRDAGGVRLTPAGKVLVARGQGLLTDADRMLDEAITASVEPEGILRVVVPIGLPTLLRTQLARQLGLGHPELRIAMHTLEEPLEFVDRPFELMLHHGDPPDRGEWFSRVILRLPMGLLAAPSYLDAHGTPTTVDALADHRLISWRTRGFPGDRWPLATGGTLAVAPWLVSSDLEYLRVLASAGGGLLFGGKIPVPDDPPVGALVPVLEEAVRGELLLRLLSPLPTRVEPRVRALVERIQAIVDAVSV